MKKRFIFSILFILVILILGSSFTYFIISKEFKEQKSIVSEKFTLVKVISEARIGKIEEIVEYVYSNSDTIEKPEELDKIKEVLKTALKENDIYGIENYTTEMNKLLNIFFKDVEEKFHEDRKFEILKYDYEEVTSVMYLQLSNYNKEVMIYNELIEAHNIVSKINSYKNLEYCDVF